MEYEERGKVLQQLVRDSNIAFVCQLFSINHQQRLFFLRQYGNCRNRPGGPGEIQANSTETGVFQHRNR